MGILDEAIREHLELKRPHGADDSELKKLEDEAFGPPQRGRRRAAITLGAEAPTEFMARPRRRGEVGAAAEPAGRRVPEHRRPAGGARGR